MRKREVISAGKQYNVQRNYSRLLAVVQNNERKDFERRQENDRVAQAEKEYDAKKKFNTLRKAWNMRHPNDPI